MKTRLSVCLLMLLTMLTNSVPGAEALKNVPYASLRRSPRKNVLFLGSVMLSRSVKLSFLNNVQLTYVAAENEMMRGKITGAEGQVIYQGDIVAKARSTKEQIVVNIANQKVKKTKQTLKDATLNLSRIEKLYKRHVFSERQHEQAQNDYLQATSDYDVCRLELVEAETNLDNMTLRAPFSGIIQKVFASAGSSLADDQPVLVLSVFNPICVKVQLHDVLTDLLCVDNKFLVYPTGFTKTYPGWLKAHEIFTDYIELSVENIIIPKRKLSPEEEKLPRVYSRMHVIKTHELPEVKVWVPASSIKKNDKESFVWLISSKTPLNGSNKAQILDVKKVRIKPKDMLIQKDSTQYQAVELIDKLEVSQVVAVKTSSNMVDGGKAIMYDNCWLFQPNEKVWVSIPQLAQYIYTVPKDALKVFEGRTFIFSIEKDNSVVPIEVYAYNHIDDKVEIIGKNLTPGMKIVCSKTPGLLYLGHKITIGKQVNF